MLKTDLKAVGYMLVSGGLSYLLAGPYWALSVLLLGAGLIAIGHSEGVLKVFGKSLPKPIFNASGEPVRPPKTTEAWVAKPVLVVAVLVVICSAIARLVESPAGSPWPNLGTPSAYPLEVSLNLYGDQLPITVPADGIGCVFLLNKILNKRLRNVDLVEIRNLGGRVAMQWPDPNLVQQALKENDAGVHVLRCVVTNHGQEDIAELYIPIDIGYGLSPESPQLSVSSLRLTNTIAISSLDRGKTFTFYIVNGCPVETDMLVPRRGTARLAGEKTTRQFEFQLAHPYYLSEGFQIGPAKNNWVGQSCAE